MADCIREKIRLHWKVFCKSNLSIVVLTAVHKEREKTAVLKTGTGLKLGLVPGNKEKATAMIHVFGCIFPLKLPSFLKETVRKLIS